RAVRPGHRGRRAGGLGTARHRLGLPRLLGHPPGRQQKGVRHLSGGTAPGGIVREPGHASGGRWRDRHRHEEDGARGAEAVDCIQPARWADALAERARVPEALPIAGGTDVMVELNFDVRRPPALLDLTKIAELAEWDTDGPRIRLGAGVTYARVITELGD